jgi:hypothetical protein
MDMADADATLVGGGVKGRPIGCCCGICLGSQRRAGGDAAREDTILSNLSQRGDLDLTFTIGIDAYALDCTQNQTLAPLDSNQGADAQARYSLGLGTAKANPQACIANLFDASKHVASRLF